MLSQILRNSKQSDHFRNDHICASVMIWASIGSSMLSLITQTTIAILQVYRFPLQES